MHARAVSLLTVLAIILVAVPLSAQTTAALDGTVTHREDSSPAAGVKVEVTSPALIGSRSTVTDPNGNYAFEALPPGEYRIGFTLEGFTPMVRSARLELARTRRLDVQLQVVELEELITVTGVPPAVTSPEVAATLRLTDIDRLPYQRNQLATAQLAPGVSANTLTNGQLQISGAPGYDNLVLVNGVVVTENTRNQIRPMYVEDAIVETTVLTGAIGAEYGRFTGGVVSTITKSGGEAFSGSLRDSLGNPSWSAVSPAHEAREDHLNHVWEGTLGGAAVHDRLWFFGAGRWARNDTARQTIAVPAFAGGTTATPASPQLSYSEGNDQKRYEAKLTARLTDAQSMAASFFAIDTKGENSRFSNNIYDAASLTARDEPESLFALRYDGQLARRFLLEAQASRREMSLSSGAFSRELIGGTVLLDRSNSNSRFGAPSLCAVCDDEQRNNDDLLLKAHYLLPSALGTHDFVAGADRFRERHYLENHQSGSDFALFVTRAQFANGQIYPVITPTNANGGGTFIRWMPILTPAHENDLRTDSLFVSDRWDVTPRWSVTLGARYDRNHAVDSDGDVSADDSRISPRFGVQWDVRGSGQSVVSASYGEYTSHIGDGIAAAAQSAGAAAAIDFAYKGPAINDKALTVPIDQALQMVFAYFNATQGGTANTSNANLRANGSRDVPGFAAYFDGTLSTPYVRETTLGYRQAFGAGGNGGYARVDLISRDWRDFYAASVNTATRHTVTPLGIPVDMAEIRNSNGIERTYRALQFQAQWTPRRFSTGVFYTWSKLRGNDEGESVNGPAANIDPSLYYPEFFGYERENPVGYLQGDQRHRLRAWIDVPLGDFSVSLLETYDSGLAYSITAPINVTAYAGAPANPGYAAVPNGRYFLTDRGALRTDGITATNLAFRYRRAVLAGEVFVQADLLNLFNEDGIADPQRLGSGVSTAANATGLQTFNPYTTTPVEGVHYRLATNFGQPLNNLAYQTPRTYRFSLGVRF
jgi:hypothetical protein